MTIKYVRHPNLTLEDDIWCDEIAEEQFHTNEDPDQAQMEDCSFDVSKRFPYAWTVIKKDEKNIGYTYILPATKGLMKQFIEGEITENRLIKSINDTVDYHNCDAAYLAGAVIMPEYQNRGYAIKSTIDTLLRMDNDRGMKITDLFIWPFTDAMNGMVDKARIFAKNSGRTLYVFTPKEDPEI